MRIEEEYRLGELVSFNYQPSRKSKNGQVRRLAVVIAIMGNDILTETRKSKQRFHQGEMTQVIRHGIVAEV